MPGICETCKISSQDTILRQTGEKLCGKCEKTRIEAKECENRSAQQSTTATSETPGTTSAPSEGNGVSQVEEDNRSAEAAVDGSPVQGVGVSKAGIKDKHSKNSSKGKIACISGCKVKTKKGGGDTYRCCLCAEWFHEKCVNWSEYDAIGL